MGYRDRRELLVLERDPGEADLLEVDVLGRPPVDLDHTLSLGGGDDRRRSGDARRLSLGDRDRALGGDRHGHDAVAGRPPAVEVPPAGPARGAARERHVRARRGVGPGEGVGDVAVARVDEHQRDVRFGAELGEGLGRRRLARGPQVVVGVDRDADGGLDRAERHRHTPLLELAVEREQAVAGEAGRGRRAGGLRDCRRGGVLVELAAGEREKQPRLPSQLIYGGSASPGHGTGAGGGCARSDLSSGGGGTHRLAIPSELASASEPKS